MPEVTEQLILNIPFTVSARTARLIGQENFANAEGAVIELVKNSYDADATATLVIINPLTDTLYIYDNGDGMTDDIIKKHWMTIGTDDKKTNFKSKGLRVRSGAKGIGRFALDRLGKKCKMLTKTLEGEGVFWQVDWGQFEEKDAVISDVKAHLHEQKDLNISQEVSNILSSHDIDKEIVNLYWKENKGTLIEISELKDFWTDASIEALYTNLEILVPPQKENVFALYLFNANEITKYGLVKSALCEDYDYKLTVTVNEDQSVKITVYRNELNVNDLIRNEFFTKTKLKEPQYSQQTFELGHFELDKTLQELVAGYKNVDKNNNLSKIGPFSFNFYYMKRGGGQEKDEEVGKYPYKTVNYSKRTDWLDKFGGIKIFRDNFRVRPYGETKSSSFDWLDLGKRALSNPTVTRPGYAVRPQQVYGELTISRIGNVNFDDKSSREGLQENDTFVLFKEVIKSIIEIFENDRNQIMMSLKKIYDDTNRKEKAKKDADSIIDKKKKKPKDSKTPPNAESETLIEAIESYKEEIEDLKDEQKLLRVLASAGLIVTSFAHELKNLSDSIVPRTEDLKEVLNELVDKPKLLALPDYLNPYIMIDDMRTQDVRLKTWLDFALASVRKDKRSRRKINMVTYIEGLERTWSSLLARRQVKLTINKWKFLEVNFEGHEIDLDGIFNNLIANSVDAFKRPDAGDKREINLSFSYDPMKSTGIHVVYEDSGPGLEKEISDPNQIFQPFFTTKRDDRTGEKIGTGLGMWIVKSTLEEYKGDIEFIDIRPGFKIKIVLPNL